MILCVSLVLALSVTNLLTISRRISLQFFTIILGYHHVVLFPHQHTLQTALHSELATETLCINPVLFGGVEGRINGEDLTRHFAWS